MKRVAIIGGGIAGLCAGYWLSRRHDVVLFEKSARIGGNAYSWRSRDGAYLDIAVAAFGQAGYKEFYALLDELDIPTMPSPTSYLSFHDLDAKDGLYLTPSLAGLARNPGLFRTANLASLARLILGLRRAQRRLSRGLLKDVTLGDCLASLPEFAGEAKIVFLCALCLLSSMEVRELLESPAEFFFSKLATHHDVISPKAVYSVRCVQGGTRRYLNALSSRWRGKIRLESRIRSIERTDQSVQVRLANGSRETFDAVVLACNPDQALSLLAEPTRLERELLGAWRYKDGRVVVHRDHSAFPPRDLIEAYTFLYTMRDGKLETSVNGALWHEPQAPKDSDYISSQHPNFPIRHDLIELDAVLRTPVFDFNSCATIPRLARLNSGRTFYCGSYFGYGLHEDAVASAKRIAERFGCV